VTPAVAVKARCATCSTELGVGEVVNVNGRHLVVVQPCPKCNGSPRQGRLDGKAGVAAPAQKTR
jgi:hypothetical protein